MSTKSMGDFAEHVWVAAGKVGRSAPKIVDAILGDVFPATVDAAADEGASKILRNGCISEVKRVLRTNPADDSQASFERIDPAFAPLVKVLNRPSYFVPLTEEEVLVADLIADPEKLDEARHFMRTKGVECIIEADKLDRLYEAVMAKRDGPPFGLPLAGDHGETLWK